jgi:hypothetical protein
MAPSILAAAADDRAVDGFASPTGGWAASIQPSRRHHYLRSFLHLEPGGPVAGQEIWANAAQGSLWFYP